jgi:hypothetical protein
LPGCILTHEAVVPRGLVGIEHGQGGISVVERIEETVPDVDLRTAKLQLCRRVPGLPP